VPGDIKRFSTHNAKHASGILESSQTGIWYIYEQSLSSYEIECYLRIPIDVIHRIAKNSKLYGLFLENTAFVVYVSKYMLGNREPFRDILKVTESDYLLGFFPEREKLVKYLFMANLGQSLFELGQCVEDIECLKCLDDVDKEGFKLRLDVWPVWGLMKPDEFRARED